MCIVISVLLIGVLGLTFFPGFTSETKQPTLLKVTSINQLMKGEYNGTYTLSQLTSQGDLGLGTFHQLDGEMIILHGICYKNQERSSDIYS